ncbi:MAG: ABC transporter ATP-binding protein [Alphaproteobacteria bacterium]|nr:ABC transporter ATP-binding protein [Alphaproteobacteria bacterium]
MNIWHFFFSLIHRNKFWFTASCVLAMLPSTISSFAALYYAKIIAIIGANPKDALSSTVITCLIISGLLYISQDLIQGLRIYVDARMKIRYQRTMHNTLFEHTHKHSARFFNTEQSGKILAKTGDLTFGMFQLFGNLRAFFLPHLAFLITTAYLLININATLGILIMLLSLTEQSIIYNLYKNLAPFIQKVAKENSKITGILADSIANARLVKNTAALYHERKKLLTQLNIKLRTQKSCDQKGGRINMFTTLISVVFFIAKFGVILWFYLNSSLSLESIIFCATMIRRIDQKTYDLCFQISQLQERLGSIKDAFALLYRPFDVVDAPNAKKLKIKTNNIEIKNLSFAYTSDKPVFQNLNLSIAPNEKIGLVGISGSGKSTLINLILRAYDLNKGKILISNQDISKVTQFSLHQNIALISQEPCLFNRSIMENIRFARPKANEEEVIKAAKLAHIHDTIMKMPKGYDSVVGERGVKLSGGERQRIAIAAAILKDAPILILDEATSALDSESEQAIEKALKELMKNKTVIAIAHRLSTLKNMDRIIVLEKGKIIENGTEKELLKNKQGTFYHLYKLQTDSYI